MQYIQRMKKLLLASITIFFLSSYNSVFASASGHTELEEPSSSEGHAMQVLDEFMSSFNNRDMEAWSMTLNYPHVRLAGGGDVSVWESSEDFASKDIFNGLVSIGWDRSAWVSRDVILASSNKVHISTEFQRFDKDNESIGKYRSLYIVTNHDGTWGVQARSSLAP